MDWSSSLRLWEILKNLPETFSFALIYKITSCTRCDSPSLWLCAAVSLIIYNVKRSVELLKFFSLGVLLMPESSFDKCQSCFSRQLPGLFGTLLRQSRPAVRRAFWGRLLSSFYLSRQKKTGMTMKGSGDRQGCL